jgi:hypothetical protein
MYRRPILILLLVLLLAGFAPIAHCADPISVKIKQIGLEGVLSRTGQPTWVQLQVQNATSEASSFNIEIFEANLAAGASAISEICTVPLALKPGEARLVDIPLHLVPMAEYTVVSVQAIDSHGAILGRTGRRVGQQTEGAVNALLCATPDLCRAIQQSILLSGTPEEQTRKSQLLRFVQLTEAPSVEWAYSSANTVIIAAPASSFDVAQQEALELFLRRGGKLVVIEDQLHDSAASNARPSFLEVYRKHTEEGRTLTVGEGQFTRFTSVSSKDFSNFFRPLGFDEGTPQEIRRQLALYNRNLQAGEPGSSLRWLMNRLGTFFRFPSFWTLLSWVVAYLLLVGIVNFVILRRAGHPEWAWITIPAIAIVFSILLYVVSTRNHPSNFGLDQMTVYRMDNLSPLATSISKVRVSAPERSFVDPVLPRDLVYIFQRRNDFIEGPAFLAGAGASGIVREFQLGDHWQTRLFLRRWSFTDMDFESHRRFAGTIFRDSAGHLHNETGINYQQAIVVDHEDIFLLDKFPAGAVVDLAHVSRRPYAKETGQALNSGAGYPAPPFAHRSTEGGWSTSEQDQKRFDQEFDALSGQSFSVLELIRGWSPVGDDIFSETKAVFFGLSSEATLSGTLNDLSPDIKADSLTIVTFGDWP